MSEGAILGDAPSLAKVLSECGWAALDLAKRQCERWGAFFVKWFVKKFAAWRFAKLRWLSGSAIGDIPSAGQIFGRFE